MRTREKPSRRAVLLIVIAILWSSFRVDAAMGADLRLRVLKGEGATNRIKKDTTSQLSVVAEDQNGSPLAGVVIVFQLPAVGAGGTFESDQSPTVFTIVTDASGQASASFRPNDRPGSFKIRVRALLETPATVDIAQTNKKTGVSPVIWALVAGGAAGGALAARGGSGGSPSGSNPPPGTTTNPTTTITVGTGTFGRPQ